MTARRDATWSAHEGGGREPQGMIGLLRCGGGLSAVDSAPGGIAALRTKPDLDQCVPRTQRPSDRITDTAADVTTFRRGRVER